MGIIMSEKWDLVDCEGNLTGKQMFRGDKQPENTWHCVVGVIIQNSEGKTLFVKRSENKQPYPNTWEHVGGCCIAGETVIEAACREVQEEIGLTITKEELKWKDSYFEKTAYVHTFLLEKEVEIDSCRIQKEEVSAIKWVVLKDILQAPEENEISPAAYRRLVRKYQTG
ncbi:MAG: NUDIX domain-containing protein [Lachnospiraceae bacterium]|nr:NUDIX domain-containing protein [Lachnospiraceae bacterium]